MAFNFPSGAVNGQQYTTDNGITYVFDGQIWNVVATPASNTLVGNVTIDGGLELTGSVSGGYSRIHFVSESSGEVGSNLSTIQMVPDINSPSSEQILIIDPTSGYPNHIHLRPGGPMDNSSTSIILGGENSNVSVVGGTNPPVQITSNNYLWQFNTDGTLIFPDYTTQTTAFTGLPIGSVSGSSQLTESLDLRYTLGESYNSDSTSFDGRITTEKERIDTILSASNANTDTFAEVVSLINSVDLTNDNAFATFYTSSNSRISSLENATGSYLTSLNGAVSSSSQLTSSFDTRYTLSASFVSSSNLSSIRTITSASYAALTPVSGTLYIIIG